MKFIIMICCTILLSNCSVTDTSVEYCGKISAPNEIPMYNRIVKNKNLKRADSVFIATSVKETGSIDSAYSRQLELAWYYFYQNKPETAIKRFNQAWLLDSTKSQAYFGFSAYTFLYGCESESEIYYKIGTSLDSEYVNLNIYHQSLVLYLTEKKNYKAVINFLLKYELNNPLFQDTESSLGFYYMEIKDYTNSKRYLDLAIQKNPNDSVAFLNLGWQNYLNGNINESIEFYNKAINIAPKYITAYANRYTSLTDIKEYDKAISDVDICIGLVDGTDKGHFYMIRGQINILAERKEDACVDFKKALTLLDQGEEFTFVTSLINKYCEK